MEVRLAEVASHMRTASQGDGSRLAENEIHVWTEELDLPHQRLAMLEKSLSADERRRIAALRLDRDRRRSAASRGLLRSILGRYTGVDPAELGFAYGSRGRPELSALAGGTRVHFNASHSGAVLLVAVGPTPLLGVDVERIRTLSRAASVARRVFTAGEREAIEGLPPEARTEAFFNCWTRKEACVKAIGEGLWSGAGRFEVSVAPGRPAAVVRLDGDRSAARSWTLEHLAPAPGYVGALAVEGTGWRVTTRHVEAPVSAP